MGWFTVVAYAVVATLCLPVGWRRTGRERAFWIVLSVILYALAVNKQLDLQSAFTAAGRCMAKAEGWYDRRKIFQLEFVVAIGAAAIALTAFLFWWMRGHLARSWLALLGTGALLAFVFIRAAGFHHVDHLIDVRISGIRMNWVFELGGIATIGANAAFLLARTARGNPRDG